MIVDGKDLLPGDIIVKCTVLVSGFGGTTAKRQQTSDTSFNGIIVVLVSTPSPTSTMTGWWASVLDNGWLKERLVREGDEFQVIR